MDMGILSKSRKLRQFIEEIQLRNRNPKDNSVLEMLEERATNPILIIKAGTVLYRARIFDNEINTDQGSKFVGYSEEESFTPPIKKTQDMRANYRYIPYLYCASNAYGAVCEVRPRFGALVSIAEIAVTDDIELFDFTFDEVPKSMSEAKENLCRALSELFAKPVTSDDDIIDYIPTQYIAEYIKNIGFDGIAYKCAISSNSKNIVVFNYGKCKATSSSVYSVTSQDVMIESKAENNPIPEVKGDLGELLELVEELASI